MTLFDFLNEGFVDDARYNCCEKMLRAANEVYGLNLDARALCMSAGFGNGMNTGDVCGALTGAVMILGMLFVKERAKEGKVIRPLTKELFARYRARMEEIDCIPLMKKYRTETGSCRNVILAAAQVVDELAAERS